MALLRKCFCCLVWVVFAFFGAAWLAGFLSGVYFYWRAATARPPTPAVTNLISISWIWAPAGAAIAALLLGILGMLPGTRLRPREKNRASSGE